ncbi:MAG TPA: DoxX family protein [Candidatus Sulfotelmatobacter sp.]|nr:DoxX family protein [Candidatus Sulfotelmatobacter sp.]
MTKPPKLARLLLAGIFLRAGWRTANNPASMAAAAAKLGFPEPEAMVRFNGAAQLTGATAMALGILPRLAAAGLAVSMVPTTLAGHRFWEVEDEMARNQQTTQFLKNLGLIGGLLAVAAWPDRAAPAAG